jgi:hypothetical protein
MRIAERDTRHLNVFIAAQVDGGQVHEARSTTVIPPDYDAMDVRALTVRRIEDTAFDLVRMDFGREPTRAALLAAVARLRGIEQLLDETIGTPDELTELRIRIREIIETGNDEARAAWGEEPEGH